jgi:hypothetical protein
MQQDLRFWGAYRLPEPPDLIAPCFGGGCAFGRLMGGEGEISPVVMDFIP